MNFPSGVAALGVCALTFVVIEALAAAAKRAGGLGTSIRLVPLMPSLDVSFTRIFKCAIALGLAAALVWISVEAYTRAQWAPYQTTNTSKSASQAQSVAAKPEIRKCTVSWSKPIGMKGISNYRPNSMRADFIESNSSISIVATCTVTGNKVTFFWDKKIAVGVWSQSHGVGYIGFWYAKQLTPREYAGKITRPILDSQHRPTRVEEISEDWWIDFRILID